MRRMCTVCERRPAAINYKKEGKTYYRKKCETCARGAKRGKPRWQQHGYEKKKHCDYCGYSSLHEEQFDVFHVDGKLNNCRPSNLKTVCANCQRILQKENVMWQEGDREQDC